MRAALIHNPNAGRAKDEAELVASLRAIGWDVIHVCERSAFEERHAHEVDVVVVAGGDGTVGAIAKMIAGTPTALAVVPMGTANNVARTLGIGVDAKVAVAALEHARERRVDIGAVDLEDGGRQLFIEGFGMGVFAHLIGAHHARAKKRKELYKAHDLLAGELETFAATSYTITVDDRDRSGEYLLVGVLNMRSFGPALHLAPDAKCDDGEVDVVLVPAEQRESLVRHLQRAAKERDLALPQFDVVRGRRVTIRHDGGWCHADDRSHRFTEGASIEVLHRTLRILAPRVDAP